MNCDMALALQEGYLGPGPGTLYPTSTQPLSLDGSGGSPSLESSAPNLGSERSGSKPGSPVKQR